MIGLQANRLGKRMIMISQRGFLDLHGCELHAIEQHAGKLAAGPGNGRPLRAVALHHTRDPQLRRDNEQEEEKNGRDSEDHGRPLAVVTSVGAHAAILSISRVLPRRAATRRRSVPSCAVSTRRKVSAWRASK